MTQIYAALSAVKDELGAVSKGNTMKGGSFSYKYRSIDDVLNALHPILVKHGVVGPVPKLVTHNRDGKKTLVHFEYTFFAADGSFVAGGTAGEGDDPGDKGTNKASTSALKTFLTQTLAIPFDTDDPDHYPSSPATADRPKAAAPKPAPKAEKSPEASGSTPSAPAASGSNERKCATCTYVIGANDPIKRAQGAYHHKACLEGEKPAPKSDAPSADDIASIIDSFPGTTED